MAPDPTESHIARLKRATLALLQRELVQHEGASRRCEALGIDAVQSLALRRFNANGHPDGVLVSGQAALDAVISASSGIVHEIVILFEAEFFRAAMPILKTVTVLPQA